MENNSNFTWSFFTKLFYLGFTLFSDKWEDIYTNSDYHEHPSTTTEYYPTTEYISYPTTQPNYYNSTHYNSTHIDSTHWANGSLVRSFNFKFHCDDFDWWHSRFECFWKVFRTRHCSKKEFRESCPFTCQTCERINMSDDVAEPKETEDDEFGPPVSEEEKTLCQSKGTLVQIGFYKLIIGRKELSWKAAHFCCQHVGATLLPFHDNMEAFRYWKYIRGGEANPFWVSLTDANNHYHNWWWQSKERNYIKKNQFLINQPDNANGTQHCGVLLRLNNDYLLDDRNCLEKHKFMCLRKRGMQKIDANYKISNVQMLNTATNPSTPKKKYVRGYNLKVDYIPHIEPVDMRPWNLLKIPRSAILPKKRYRRKQRNEYNHTLTYRFLNQSFVRYTAENHDFPFQDGPDGAKPGDDGDPEPEDYYDHENPEAHFEKFKNRPKA